MLQKFNSFLTRKGETVTIATKTLTGTDTYGDPTYSEVTANSKAFVERIVGGEIQLPAGTVEIGDIALLFSTSTTIAASDLYEVEYKGVRYKITALEQTGIYKRVYARRKVS